MLLFSVALAFGVTGCVCSNMNGGGTLETATEKKATFAFQIKCDDSSEVPVASGMLQFNDHSEGIKFHAAVDSCDWTTETEGTFYGTYTPQPKKLGKGGNFAITLQDGGNGKAGISGDFASITLTGGIYNGYSISGNLSGGNIKAKK